jgi:hypothetical protein
MPTILVPSGQSPSGANELIGRGVVMFDPLDPITGLRSGVLRHIGNISKLEISDKVEVKEKYESMDPQGLLYARAVVRQTVTLKITGDEITADNFAAAINGVVTQEINGGGTVGAQALGPTSGLVGGQYYSLGQANIDPTSLTLSSGTAGVDYIVTDPVAGTVYIPPGSTLAGATGVTASYTAGASTFNIINVAAQPSLECYVAFYGNPVKGRTFHHEYWHVSFTPTGKLEMISDNFAEFELEGMVIADTINHPLQPIGIVRQVA